MDAGRGIRNLKKSDDVSTHLAKRSDVYDDFLRLGGSGALLWVLQHATLLFRFGPSCFMSRQLRPRVFRWDKVWQVLGGLALHSQMVYTRPIQHALQHWDYRVAFQWVCILRLRVPEFPRQRFHFELYSVRLASLRNLHNFGVDLWPTHIYQPLGCLFEERLLKLQTAFYL